MIKYIVEITYDVEIEAENPEEAEEIAMDIWLRDDAIDGFEQPVKANVVKAIESEEK